MPDDIPGAVVNIIELVGSSDRSFSDAVRNAVRRASRTIRHIQGVDVISSNAEVGDNGEITVYKVNCKLAFLVEGTGGVVATDEMPTTTATGEGANADLAEMASREPPDPPYAESGGPDISM